MISKHLCSQVSHPWPSMGLEVALITPIPAHVADSPMSISGADAKTSWEGRPQGSAQNICQHTASFIGVFHLKCSYVFGLASHFPQSSVKSLPTSKAQLESSSPRKVFPFLWLHFYTPACASRPNRTISTQIILSSMHALPQPASTSSLRRGTRGLFILK